MTSSLYIRRGESVRLYQDDGWFIDGHVSLVDEDDGTVDVDFGDFVQRYPKLALRRCWPDDGTYECVLVPFENGIQIEDFSIAA